MILPREASISFYWLISLAEDAKHKAEIIIFFKTYISLYPCFSKRVNFLFDNFLDDFNEESELKVVESYKLYISKNPTGKDEYLSHLENCLECISENAQDVKKVMDLYRNEEPSLKFEKEHQNIMIEEKLQNLVGLSDIKKEIENLQNLALINIKRTEMGLKAKKVAMHMVFSGAPGTGKTTVARIIGEIYYELGIIKSKNVIEVSREDLVAEYLGQSEIKTKKVLESAKDGVLFIDEAYTLSNGKDEYGTAVINTILKFMEDNRDNTLIIVAGYTKEMEKFIKANPGLESRFNTYLNFPNYSAKECVEILKKFAEVHDYEIEKKSLKKLEKYFDEIPKDDESFSNARFVRNLFEKAIKKQSSRVISLNNPNKEDFVILREEDFDID